MGKKKRARLERRRQVLTNYVTTMVAAVVGGLLALGGSVIAVNAQVASARQAEAREHRAEVYFNYLRASEDVKNALVSVPDPTRNSVEQLPSGAQLAEPKTVEVRYAEYWRARSQLYAFGSIDALKYAKKIDDALYDRDRSTPIIDYDSGQWLEAYNTLLVVVCYELNDRPGNQCPSIVDKTDETT